MVPMEQKNTSKIHTRHSTTQHNKIKRSIIMHNNMAPPSFHKDKQNNDDDGTDFTIRIDDDSGMSEDETIIERLKSLRRRLAAEHHQQQKYYSTGGPYPPPIFQKFVVRTQFSVLLERSITDEILQTLQESSSSSSSCAAGAAAPADEDEEDEDDGIVSFRRPRWKVARFDLDGFASEEQRLISQVLALQRFQGIEIKLTPGCRCPNSLLNFFQQNEMHNLDSLLLEGIQMSHIETHAFAQSIAGTNGPKELRLSRCTFKDDSRGRKCSDEESSSSSKNLHVDCCCCWSPEESLAVGLAGNHNLRSLTIEHSTTHDDIETATILQGLVGHPSLQELCLKYNNIGPHTIRVLHRILSNPRIASLWICSRGGGGGDLLARRGCEFNVESFLENIPPDNRLETLGLTRDIVNTDIANTILRNLHTNLPYLRVLDLGFNLIDGWDRLTKDLVPPLLEEEGGDDHLRTQQALRSLILCNNACHLRLLEKNNRHNGTKRKNIEDEENHDDDDDDDDHPFAQHIRSLLRAFPGLGNLGKQIMDDPQALPASILYQLDRNRCCGPLMLGLDGDDAERGGHDDNEVVPAATTTTTSSSSKPSIPLAIWPLVLERAKQDPWLQEPPTKHHDDHDTNEMKTACWRLPTLIYQVLQGAPLLGRAALS